MAITGGTMAIELTRTQVLELMKDLNVDHWFQKNLLDELNRISTPAVVASATPHRSLAVTKIRKAADEHFDEPVQCSWQTYGYQCTNRSSESFCEDHRLVCRELGCNNMANHGCPCELQFVCGAALCANHSSCSDHYRR